MHRLFTTLLAALAVTWCGSTMAQQQNGDGADEEAGAIAEQYRDWVLRCRKRADTGDEACLLAQRLVTQENQQVVLRVNIGLAEDNDNQPVAIFLFPLGLYLPAGAEFRIEGAAAQKMEIARCFPRGCRAVLPLDDALLRAMRAGSRAEFVVQRNPGDEVALGMSLMGFSAGYRALMGRK